MSRHTRGENAPEQTDALYTSLSKLDVGEHRFRIITGGISGRQYFPESGGVTRVDKKPTSEPTDGRMSDYGRSTWKFFYAFGVINVDTMDVSIMHLDKMGVVQDLENYIHDEDYGDPRGYDIVIVKEGKGKDTKYSLKVKPPKDLSDDIIEEANKYEFNFDEYYIAKGKPITLKPLEVEDDEVPFNPTR